ncbi:signal peptidase II [Gemmatimonas sp.]|uniref:signal peptidase II n=1 Tax=Gemmatimonas sp. TaxID=1962908 RepID=UPI003563BCC5
MKALVAIPVLLVVLVLDLITKAVAVATLAPAGGASPVFGNWFRFALVYNPGAAFGLHLGNYSRWIFMALTCGAIVILWRLYQQTAPDDLRKALAVSLVAAGALGNVIDRIRSDLGVVDFIDIGFGVHRWPTFNVADMAVSSGAFLLALVLWGEEKRETAAAAAAVAAEQSAARIVSAPAPEQADLTR